MSTSPQVDKMIAAFPARDKNPIGQLARSSILNKIIYSTPGTEEKISSLTFASEVSFRSVFYPGVPKSPLIDQIVSVTNLTEEFWRTFSIALICQEIWEQGPLTRPSINQELIAPNLLTSNAALSKVLVPWYIYVFKTSFKEFATPFSGLQDKPTALKNYMQDLTSPEYREAIKELTLPGAEIDLTWVFFHHWIKLKLLGAGSALIGSVIKTLSDQGLVLSPVISAKTWVTYIPWMQPVSFSARDIDGIARGPVLSAPTAIISIGAFTSLVGVKEGWSKCFVIGCSDDPAKKPGRIYFRAPQGSCFSEDTKVLMADGSARLISKVQLGDKLKTPHGSGEVIMMPRPVRGRRSLYEINNLQFRCTASHPFVHPQGLSESGSPEFLCLDPWGLRHAVPTMARLGVGQMKEGSQLTTWKDDQIDDLDVSTITEYLYESNKDGEEILYDLVLELNESGRSQYFVGDGNTWLLVASEIPVFTEAPFTTIAILELTSASAQDILSLMNNVSQIDFPEKMETILDALPNIISEALADSGLMLSENRLSEPSHDFVNNFLKEFNQSDGEGNYIHRWQLGQYYEALAARYGDELTSAIELGWRTISTDTKGDSMAISVLDLHLNHAHSIDPNKVLKIEMNVNDSPKEVLVPTAERNSTFFAHHIESVSYMKKSENTNIHFNIKVDDEIVYQAEGSFLVDHSYQRTELIVRDMDSVVCGLLSLDARILSDFEIKSEKSSRINWGENKSAFAKNLGFKMAEQLQQELQITQNN